MPKMRSDRPAVMLDRIASALAREDAGSLKSGPDHYRHLAAAALKSLLVPTESMINAAHAAVEFDNAWAINSRADFRRALRAMITHAIAGELGADE
jgi:hypothetical protein